MSRTLLEINSSLDSNITTAITSPSSSQFAEWKLWKSIFAAAIWAFEQILDVFKTEIETKVETKQPASIAWYNDRVLEFQGANDQGGNFQGDNLIVVNGVPKYEITDIARRLIAQASLKSASGILAIKLAKILSTNTYQQLNSSELLAFNIYLGNIKFPGTSISVLSFPADIIKYDVVIIYDPVYTIETITANIEAKKLEYRTSMGFDDTFYDFKFLEKLSEATGVVSIKRNHVEIYSYTTAEYTEVDIAYTLESGYFNYNEIDSVLTFVNYKTL